MDKYGNKLRFRSWGPRFYDNETFPTGVQNPDLNVSVVDALMATSAAPTYWPIYKGHVDGGIKYNNPAMIALTEAVKRGVPLEDIVLISFGTGAMDEFLDAKKGDWGIGEWGRNLINLLISDDRSVDVQVKNLIGKRFLRIQPVLKHEVKLDNVEEMDYLEKEGARFDLTEATEFFSKYFVSEVDILPPLKMSSC